MTLPPPPLLLILCLLLSSGHAADDQPITFQIRNKCPFAIWPATAPNAGHPVIAGGGFFLPSGMTKRIRAPSVWNGRLWARTGCDFSASKPGCQTGDCQGLLACNGTVGLPPATLLELSLRSGEGKPSSNYDVSLVDGYNLPVSVSVSARPADPGCFIGGCRRSPTADCPQELRVMDEAGQSAVACKSACLAFGLDQFCCRNAYGTPEACKPTAYSRAFKDACPSYVSYAFDTPAPLASCAARDYVVTFCPSKWSSV